MFPSISLIDPSGLVTSYFQGCALRLVTLKYPMFTALMFAGCLLMEKINFTKSSLMALATTGKRYHVYDNRVMGLAVRVESSGSKYFYYIKRDGLSVHQLKLGRFPDMTVEQARDKATEMNAAIVTGNDPRKASARPRHEKTFKELFDWWLETSAKPHRKTWSEDKANFERYLVELGRQPASRLTKAEWTRFHAELGAKRGKRTANRVLETVRAIFNHAIKHGLYDGNNPASGVELFECAARERRLMPGEAEAFFRAVEACPYDYIRDYVYLSLFTGQRQGNVLAMRWDQLDLVNGIWRIPVTKNGRPLVVPLLEAEIQILKRRKQTVDSPWVFPSPRVSASGHMMEPKKSWAQILQDAGITDFRIHDLRRSLGSFMGDTGASLPMIGNALGHKSHAPTLIYTRLSSEPVRGAKHLAIQAMFRAAGPNSEAKQGDLQGSKEGERE